MDEQQDGFKSSFDMRQGVLKTLHDLLDLAAIQSLKHQYWQRYTTLKQVFTYSSMSFNDDEKADIKLVMNDCLTHLNRWDRSHGVYRANQEFIVDASLDDFQAALQKVMMAHNLMLPDKEIDGWEE